MGFLIPQTGLSYHPSHTDWEFLLPLEVSDEELAFMTDNSGIPTSRQPPMISGFIALIKVFACVVDILDILFPGTPQRYSLSSISLAASLFCAEDAEWPVIPGPSRNPLLDHFYRLVTRLHGVINGLPDELKPSYTHRPSSGGDYSISGGPSAHFAIMRTNIHVTSLYIQAMVLEMCLGNLADTPGKPGEHTGDIGHMPGDSPNGRVSGGLLPGEITAQLRRHKNAIAMELLSTVSSSLLWALESNGQSIVSLMSISPRVHRNAAFMPLICFSLEPLTDTLGQVGKIREVAATLLGQQQGQDSPASGSPGEQREEYLGHFAKILAELDYAHGTPQG